MAVWASEIAMFLGRPLCGKDMLVNKVKPVTNPEANSLLFMKKCSSELLDAVNSVGELLVLAAPEFERQLHVPYMVTPNPRLDFAKVLQQFFAPPRRGSIAGTAIIAPSAKLGRNVSVGHYSVIGENVQIGDDTEIRDHVVIRDNCIIGRNCLIRSNTVIGEEGAGFEFDDDGTSIRILHSGRVVIGDEVEIGALNMIAQGTLGDTILARGVKTGDLVLIAHNVEVGENSLVIGGTVISGSVRIGKNVWISPQVTIINKIEIGDDAMVGIGAVVIKSVEPNVVVFGNPARILGKRFKP